MQRLFRTPIQAYLPNGITKAKIITQGINTHLHLQNIHDN